MKGSLNLLHLNDLLKTQIRSETKHCCVLFGCAQQFCSAFLGNIFIGKIEQKQTIFCLKYHNINFVFIELVNKINITFSLLLFETKTALV